MKNEKPVATNNGSDIQTAKSLLMKILTQKKPKSQQKSRFCPLSSDGLEVNAR